MENTCTPLQNLLVQEIKHTLHILSRRTRATDPACKHQRRPDAPFFTRLDPRSCNRRLEHLVEWDRIAEERRVLLEKRRVDWDAVDQTLLKHNAMLQNCPCPQLACTARLCKYPLNRSLRLAGILVYAVIGRFRPYSGQLGVKTKRPRTPIHRLAEHAARSVNLRRHVVGRRKRNLRSIGRVINPPSLPKTLARVGVHKASILLLQPAT